MFYVRLKWSSFIDSIARIVLSGIIIFFLGLDLTTQGSYAAPIVPENSSIDSKPIESHTLTSIPRLPETSLARPIRLKIPKIKVDTTLEYVGLTSQGAMAVPKELAQAAWFNLGPHPGEIGSAVIAGHFGWKNGVPAVFNNLYTLRAGDTLFVEDEEGVATTFIVREIRTYEENENAHNVFSSIDGKAHLNLITCKGVWDEVKKSFPKRLIVFTDKIVS